MTTKTGLITALKEARSKGERPAAPLADLRYANLRDADLRYANLRDADLRHADLRYANLYGANLNGADLHGADLYGANLYGADLYGADLRGADLYGANLGGTQGGVLSLAGLPSGVASIVPTADGWLVRVGCWSGTVDGLEALISGDEDWPEARGGEIARRRPGLEAFIALTRAHIAIHERELTAVKAKWGEGS